MDKVLKINGFQLSKIIMGKTLTVSEMHALLRYTDPNYDPGSLAGALKVLKSSCNCHMEVFRSGCTYSYHLISVNARFYKRSVAATKRKKNASQKTRLSFSEAEKAFIQRANEFDRLLRSVRTSPSGNLVG